MNTSATFSPASHDDGFVLVSIPQTIYPQIIKAINDALPSQEASVTPAFIPPSAVDSGPFEDGEVADVRGWTRQAVAALKRDTTIESVIALFELAGQKHDSQPVSNIEVSIVDIENATGKSMEQVRGDVRRISTYAKKALAENVWGSWPFWTDTGSDRRAIYRVPAVVLQWWREA